jgi:hypothetical protein
MRTMKQFSINVLATPYELLEWAVKWAESYSLFMAAIRLQPKWTMTAINAQGSSPQDTPASTCDQIWLSVDPFSTGGATYFETMANNPQRLTIAMSKESKEGLRAGGIGTVSADERTLKIWGQIRGDLKQRTLAGLWVINPKTGDKGFYKNERYTLAVKRLADKGVKLFPVAGTNELQIVEAPSRAT